MGSHYTEPRAARQAAPIRKFLRYVSPLPQRSLADLGRTPETYGRRHATTVGGRPMEVLPLVHPRQAGALGRSNAAWTVLHQQWMARRG